MSEGKKIVIIAGPNGAGKTTFAREFLPNEANCPVFVNADLIAAGIAPFQPETAAFRAGRLTKPTGNASIFGNCLTIAEKHRCYWMKEKTHEYRTEPHTAHLTLGRPGHASCTRCTDSSWATRSRIGGAYANSLGRQ